MRSFRIASAVLLCAVTCLSSANFSAAGKDTDEERFKKTELLIEEMLEEDGPKNGSLWNKENTDSFKWSYINGCMASAMLKLADAKGNSRCSDFADSYMSSFISENKYESSGYIDPKANFSITNYTLDDINSGKSLIELIILGSDNSKKYKNAVSDTLYEGILKYMVKNKKTAENNLWHKNSYPYQVWLDGIYMETPFWLEYELEISKDPDKFVEAANHVTNQISNVYAKMRDPQTGLYYHGYDSRADSKSKDYKKSEAMSWASNRNACSANFWLRGTGWYAMALVDDIEFMQKAEDRFGIDLSTQKEKISSIYLELMESLLRYRDPDTGLWYQVIDRGGDKYNYTETSGSAAISYALMKGSSLGIADNSCYEAGLDVFRDICDYKLLYADDKKTSVTLKDICQTAGLGGTSSSATIGYYSGERMSRDGSYEYYVSEKTVENDAKGVAPFLFAYCQILKKAPDDTSGGKTDENSEDAAQKPEPYAIRVSAARIIRYILDPGYTLDKAELQAADFDDSGAIDIRDSINILRQTT